MNLQLVPRYRKYNRTLSQVFFVSVPANFRASTGSYEDDLPVPIKIDPYKQKKHRQVRVISAHGGRGSSIRKLILLKKNKNESYTESEKGCCGVTRWCAKRKALKEIENENKRRAKQAEQWRKWKYKEADKVERARAKAELEREAEYLRQAQEIEEQRRKLVKDTLKTRYHRPVKIVIPKRSFNDNLSTEPYYPKPANNVSSYDDFNVKSTVKSKKERKREKQELKKKEKEEKKRQKSNVVPFVEEPPPDCKCSKFKSYFNKIKGKEKKSTIYINYDEIYNDKKSNKKEYNDKKRNKEEKDVKLYSDPYINFKKDKPYNPYKDLYDKPYESKKHNKEDIKSYTDVYQYYDDTKLYGQPTKTQCEPACSRRKSKDDDDLYARYYDLYGGESSISNKQKKTKTKNQKITKTDLEKRKSTQFSQKFVNCFYRTCCECCCWFSIFLIIGFALIMTV